ncbi:MAG: hypothetical protein LBI63_00580 [Candidatus Ancillula sp.]|jgi:hypothetical protein|nr:hypothetical protein [Candidatus Ancillula sp.]
MVILTRSQKELMREFYSLSLQQVVLNKSQRNRIWHFYKANKEIPQEFNLQRICPALFNEILRALNNNSNIQSAVFSECSFAQTLANMLNLQVFTDYRNNHAYLQAEIVELLETYNMFPRYIYSNEEQSRVLIQAGGCNGVDSALISVVDYNVFTIEFKEAGAKSSEPDLPKYGEDGKLLITEEFKQNYPQFVNMLSEHIGYNVFENMGHNENNFSPENIKTAISNNYNAKKFADVICTEDINGYLVMIPANQISQWARLQGEIRTAWRNSYDVWTPNRLVRHIEENDGTIQNNVVSIPSSSLTTSQPRGGLGISRYKINNLFFIRAENVNIKSGKTIFNMDSVRQLNPTITAKMFFDGLDVNDVKNYYKGEL